MLATWSSAKVGPDIHVKVGPALYSVPWALIGQRVQARSTATMVQIVHAGAVVATHVRAERGRVLRVALFDGGWVGSSDDRHFWRGGLI